MAVRLLTSGCLKSLKRTRVILQHLAMSSSASDEEVLLEKVDSKGVITLNRPKALNTLNLPMVRKIYPKLKEWEADPNMTMVIIKAVGDRAFCAGGDIRAIYDDGRGEDAYGRNFFKEEYILNHKIGTLKIPWIAFIHGITMGGGVGLSVHGHFRVATEKTMFAMPETAIALFPDVGGGYFLPRLTGKLGIYLALTGFRLRGRDVQRAGVATHFVEYDKMPDLEKELLSLKNATEADIATVLQKYQQASKLDEDKEFILAPHMDQINKLFAGKELEDIYKNLEQDGTDWAKKQLDTLSKMSPTSMKITLRQLQQGANMTFKEVFQMEYRLGNRCVDDKDFFEGVRAVLVDKDQNPKWDPATIEGVTKEKVDWYFSPLPSDRDLTPDKLD